MSLPEYQVLVLDCRTGNVLTIFDGASFVDLRYSRKLNGVGLLAMTLPGTQTNYDYFGWDNFIEVKRSDPETGSLITEETYLCRSRQLYTDDDDQDMLVIGGLSLNHLIARRLVNPFDDPLSVGGYSTKSGAGDVVIRSYVREQMADLASVARQTPGLSILPIAGVGLFVSDSRRYDNLLTAITDLAISSGIDFQITRSSGASLSMQIAPLGFDRTRSTNYPFAAWVGLSPNRRNLSKPVLKIDRSNEQNFVYVLGQGQGDLRQVLTIAGDTSISPFGRIEYTRDARNIDKTNTTGLSSAGATSINKNKAFRDFSFSPTNVEPGNIYRLDWDVGDRITVLWKGEEIDLRVTGVELQISANGESIDTTVQELYN